MKNYIKLSAALPLMLLAASCSDKDAPEVVEGDYNVVMTVGGVQETRAMDPEIAKLKQEYLNFATYNDDGSLKHFIYEGADNKSNADISAIYFRPNWGPSVAARLPRAQYKDGFNIASFNVPAVLRQTKFAHASLDDAAMNLLVWPTVANNLWNPEKEADNLMPMAGITKVTAADMGNYNEYVYDGINPFRLPDVSFTRALAKIVIVDCDGIIGKVELKSPKYGSLCPETAGWLRGDAVLRPQEAKGMAKEMITQTMSAPTRQTSEGEDVYEFYSFEHSYYEANGTLAPAMADIRKVATLYATPESGLVGTNRETTPVRMAPYTDFEADQSLPLATHQNGVWQGVMRNTVYTFYVHRPPTGGVQIEVKATPWEQVRDTFEF